MDKFLDHKTKQYKHLHFIKLQQILFFVNFP